MCARVGSTYTKSKRYGPNKKVESSSTEEIIFTIVDCKFGDIYGLILKPYPALFRAYC